MTTKQTILNLVRAARAAEARAWERNLPRPRTERDAVLAATGRSTEPAAAVGQRSVKQIMKEIAQ